MTFKWKEPEFTSPSSLSDWLLDPRSLTAKLKARATVFHVELLFQREEACMPHEAEFLAISEHDRTLVREVLLHCDHQPWVYARSILPLASLSAQDQALAQMGTNPLGEQLFTRPEIQPGRIQVAEFAADSRPGKLNAQYYGPKAPLWGRRRLFHLQEGAISVAEVFLSPTPCYA